MTRTKKVFFKFEGNLGVSDVAYVANFPTKKPTATGSTVSKYTVGAFTSNTSRAIPYFLASSLSKKALYISSTSVAAV